SVVFKRKAFGRRTAWLLPDWKTFAVVTADPKSSGYEKYILRSGWVESHRVPFLWEQASAVMLSVSGAKGKGIAAEACSYRFAALWLGWVREAQRGVLRIAVTSATCFARYA